jgi:hypothetical protein
MASISRINPSLAALTNENTFALANVNIDFSMIKVTAPVEYNKLGMVLSSSRRKEAEEGELHRELVCLY